MVGGAGDPGGGAADLMPGLRAGYEAAASWWAAGPERVYTPLGAALIGATASPVSGLRVLDLGAGTGVAGRAALAAGAGLVVAADVAAPMLRLCRPPLRPVIADATALPFRPGSFDLVVAAFVLSHLPSVAAGLAEARRVGRELAASAFVPGWTHPAKAAVDAVLGDFGYRPPSWYAAFKHETEPRAGDPRWLAAQASAAGFTEARLRAITVPTGVSAPGELASWRLGMAHTAPFVQSLDPAAKARIRHAAVAAVAGCPPLTVPMWVLTAW
jgi:ubiquinone/menaquinone biosynthesis C-methylase UbiE